jgi:TatD DNase family protein
MWIDSHCHPFSKAFDKDRDEVIQRARDAGVSKMIVVGYSKDGNRKVVDMIHKNDDMWGTVGIHPCDCEELTDEEIEWMKKTAVENDRVVAIGEMGLDYHHMSSTKGVQEEVFRKQIRMAKELDLPCVIHSRDAAEETLAILIDEKAEKVIFHCYSYGHEFAKKVWAEGYYTSFSGVVTYPKATDVQEAAANAPAELILIETDCPYLAPQSHRGKRNEMAFVVEVGKKVAELRGVSNEELAGQVEENLHSILSV